MCDFINFIQPQKNKIECEFSMWLSLEMREGSHVLMMRLWMLLSRYSGFTCKFKF